MQSFPVRSRILGAKSLNCVYRNQPMCGILCLVWLILYFNSLKSEKKTFNLVFQSPSANNCESLHATAPYMVQFPGSHSSRLNVSSTAIDVYAGWKQTILFSVWAKNSAGMFSAPATLIINSPIKRKLYNKLKTIKH